MDQFNENDGRADDLDGIWDEAVEYALAFLDVEPAAVLAGLCRALVEDEARLTPPPSPGDETAPGMREFPQGTALQSVLSLLAAVLVRTANEAAEWPKSAEQAVKEALEQTGNNEHDALELFDAQLALVQCARGQLGAKVMIERARDAVKAFLKRLPADERKTRQQPDGRGRRMAA